MKKKNLLLDAINEAIKQFDCELFSWVILEDHYHILIKLVKGNDLSKIVQSINGRSSRRLKRLLTAEGRLISLPSLQWKVWDNYWDKCIGEQHDFSTHMNYIYNNPVKHGYVKHMEDYRFSSYNRLDKIK